MRLVLLKIFLGIYLQQQVILHERILEPEEFQTYCKCL